MLNFLLIIMVIAVALAPLTHFLPSKRTRKVARMRESAAILGLFVEFRDLPGAGNQRGATSGVIYYGKRLPNMRAKPIETAAWGRTQGEWRSVGHRLPVPLQVQELSMEIIAASVDQSSCGVYWAESAGEEEVQHIAHILERWCEDLTR